MIFGDLRSSFSPTGKEYVTRWGMAGPSGTGGPLAAALAGVPSSPPSFGRGNSVSPSSGGAGDAERGMGPDGPAPEGAAPGGLGLGGMGGMVNSGSIGNTLGGLAGSAISGTGIGGVLGGIAGGMAGGQSAGRASGSAIGSGLGFAFGGLPGAVIGGYLGGKAGGAAFGDGIADPYGGVSNTGSPYGGTDPESGNDGLAGYGPGAFGDSAGAGVGSDGSTSEAGSSSSSVGDGGASAGGFYSRGGKVNAAHLMGPNPPGPDDGFGGLDHGEFVIRASSAEKLGPELLKKLNSGDFKREALVRALMGK